jgi:hypothetical protein
MESLTTLASQVVLPKLPPLDYRLLRWAPNDLEPRSWPFCGAQNGQVLRRPDALPVAYYSWRAEYLSHRLHQNTVTAFSRRRVMDEL